MSSPFVLVYNLYDIRNRKECIAIYDLLTERVVYQIKFDSYTNVFEPMAILGKDFILYRRSTHSYLILNMESLLLSKNEKFKIKSEIVSGNKRIFKRISMDKFLINIRVKDDDDAICIFTYDKKSKILIKKIIIKKFNRIHWDLEWYEHSCNSIIYKKNNNVKVLNIHNPVEKHLLQIPELNGICDRKVSDDGQYLAILIESNKSLKVYAIGAQGLDNKCRFEENEKKVTKNFYLFKTYLIYEVDENLKYITYLVNLDTNKKIIKKCEWIKCTKNDDHTIITSYYSHFDGKNYSNYLWCVKSHRNVKTKNIVKNEIYTVNFEDIKQSISLDTGNKLNACEFGLINNGDGLLAKKLNCLEFVIFSVYSQDKKPNLNLNKYFENTQMQKIELTNDQSDQEADQIVSRIESNASHHSVDVRAASPTALVQSKLNVII